jgi:2-polyprenyl-6-methoxyphenol hydroxylase-like FAD-dependent oxidoreductase
MNTATATGDELMSTTTTSAYDAIIVGARCAGSATALLLARRGHRVLLVDRAHFPSDTVSTHLIHPRGVAALQRWGLLEELTATGCPAIDTYRFDFGPIALTGTPSRDETPAYCPRRVVLDSLLLDAAARAGAEIREGFTVQGLETEGDRVIGIRGRSTSGAPVTEHATVVIGADGEHSLVAEAVGARRYHELPPRAVAYYSYWGGVGVSEAIWSVRPRGGFGAFPTHDGLTMILAAWPFDEFATVKEDVPGNYHRAVRAVYGDWLGGAHLEERVVGRATTNHFRVPHGRGWVLVGDAGYVKDPVTAQGMTDAFLDAEVCSTAVHDVLTGRRSFSDAMSEYQRLRDDRVLAMYRFTTDLASLDPPSAEFQQLLALISGQQRAMDEFVGLFAGAVSPAEFFDPNHLAALVDAPAGGPAATATG